MIKKKPFLGKRKIKRWVAYTLKVLLGILIISPVLVGLSFSFKSSEESMMAFNSLLDVLPKQPTLENYEWVLENIDILGYLKNTFIQCAIVIVMQLLLCSFAAYALTYYEFKAKSTLFMLVLASMMIPGDVVIITNYLSIQNWGLTNTHFGMAVPYFISGMGIFLMRQFYLTLPRDLKEASEIDGCTDMGFFFRIAMPLSVPSLAGLAIYQFINIYNRYFWPLLVTNSKDLRTIQIGIAMLNSGESRKPVTTLAGSMLCIIPVAIVFIIGQKYLVKGMTAGAVKG